VGDNSDLRRAFNDEIDIWELYEFCYSFNLNWLRGISRAKFFGKCVSSGLIFVEQANDSC
jgi:hypothetical protein